jgi:hypothetical protein
LGISEANITTVLFITMVIAIRKKIVDDEKKWKKRNSITMNGAKLDSKEKRRPTATDFQLPIIVISNIVISSSLRYINPLKRTMDGITRNWDTM